MIVIASAIIGAIWGYVRATKAGGNKFDIAQYTAVHAIALALLGLLATLVLERLLQGG